MKILRLNREFLGELRDLATSQVLNKKGEEFKLTKVKVNKVN